MNELTLADLYEGDFYHVCTEGLENAVIMKDDEDYKVARNYLALSAWKTKAIIVAFSLMSNHLHSLIGAKDRRQASEFIRYFKQVYSTYLRNKYGMSDALKGQPENIVMISDIKYFRNCIAYILRNAVCAKICRRVDEYPWSSYGAYFQTGSYHDRFPIATLKGRRRKAVLKTRMNLDDCPYYVDAEGNITVDSFVKSEVVHHAFNWSGKLFLFCLGCCNDSQMEYELVSRPMVRASDQDLLFAVEEYVSRRFKGKTISVLTTSEKCSILKRLFYEYKSSVPQLSRVLGLPRDLVRKVLVT